MKNIFIICLLASLVSVQNLYSQELEITKIDLAFPPFRVANSDPIKIVGVTQTEVYTVWAKYHDESRVLLESYSLCKSSRKSGEVIYTEKIKRAKERMCDFAFFKNKVIMFTYEFGDNDDIILRYSTADENGIFPEPQKITSAKMHASWPGRQAKYFEKKNGKGFVAVFYNFDPMSPFNAIAGNELSIVDIDENMNGNASSYKLDLEDDIRIDNFELDESGIVHGILHRKAGEGYYFKMDKSKSELNKWELESGATEIFAMNLSVVGDKVAIAGVCGNSKTLDGFSAFVNVFDSKSETMILAKRSAADAADLGKIQLEKAKSSRLSLNVPGVSIYKDGQVSMAFHYINESGSQIKKGSFIVHFNKEGNMESIEAPPSNADVWGFYDAILKKGENLWYMYGDKKEGTKDEVYSRIIDISESGFKLARITGISPEEFSTASAILPTSLSDGSFAILCWSCYKNKKLTIFLINTN